MQLTRLIAPLTVKAITGPNGRPFAPSDAPDIGSIHYRSDDVKPGGLFIALKGFKTDGHQYIADAINRGATAILAEKSLAQEPHKTAHVVVVENTRRAMAQVAACFYDYPLKKLFLIGITGTNGKTTITYIVESILSRADIRVGVIGTINYRYAGQSFANPMTTPESLDLQRILADMAACGVTHVVMEVSSHAIALNRIDGCLFDVAAFTNLSQDHLDFHQSMDAYWQCKARLFNGYLRTTASSPAPVAVINQDDPHGRELRTTLSSQEEKLKIISFSKTEPAEIIAQDVEMGLSGISALFRLMDQQLALHAHLVGAYNLENILCAIGIAYALNLSLTTIKAGIESFQAVPGRLEPIINPKDRFVFVDYAHTPDALENVLSTVRALTDGSLIVIFGCGGDRDRSKRPLMGQIAAQYADLCIVTSDNPRTEAPDQIIAQICKGIEKIIPQGYTLDDLPANAPDGKRYVIESNRRRAIEWGIRTSRSGDAVIIAGKGHETYQILKEKTIAFDDRIEARQALNSI